MTVRSENETLRRLGGPDVTAFVTAFVTGVIAYFTLRIGIQPPEGFVLLTMVLIMFLYALVVVRNPRLRLRMDQAADNAYYLGLLFTLMSMAYALYRYGSASEVELRKIIQDFGVGLGTTIAGVFLRVWLHQMRIDPADVEGVTRIELAEASKGLRASLDSVTIDLGKFHDEVRQRSSDLMELLVSDARQSLVGVNDATTTSAKEMLVASEEAHKSVLTQTRQLTELISGATLAAVNALNQLRAVEPPPLTLSRRLDRLTKTLDDIGEQTSKVAARMADTGGAATEAVSQIAGAVDKLGALVQQVERRHLETSKMLEELVRKSNSSLEAVSQRLVGDRQKLLELEEQSRRSVAESVRAQEAAVNVLTSMTSLARGLTEALEAASGNDGHGKR